MSTTDQDPIRILHLSDIHFRAGMVWDAEPVLRNLNGFIETEVKAGLAPDLVAITGDLAFAGTAEEYALARAWLDDLWNKLGDLPRDRLLLVPGNHDVDRKKIGGGVRSMQAGLLKGGSQDDIAALLSDDDERRIMLRRHTAYLDFLVEWLGQWQALPWWQRVIEVRSAHLHVAGLDSAWMACGDEDRGRLLLGRYQITQTVETGEAEGADWRIALLHHPWDYITEFDYHATRQSVHQHCDLLLRGHLHTSSSERVLPPDPSRSCLELAAGCVYENGHGYPNAFQWIELSQSGKRVRVMFRAWLHNAWTVDRNQPNCPDGQADFDLEAAPTPVPGVAGRPIPAEIPAAYYNWLRRSLEKIELLGAKEGRAVTLNHVYVPALTIVGPRTIDELQDFDAIQNVDDVGRHVPLLQRLDQESLYVSAAAGAGKSTFCRWAVLQSVAGTELTHPVPAPEDFAEPVPANLRTRLPLLVRLREFWRSMNCGRGERTWHRPDLEKALANWIDRAQLPGLTGARLRAHLNAGSAFLVFDGLDEVPVAHRLNGVTTYPRELLLSGLADALPDWRKAGNRILLTSRPYGLDKAGLHRLGLPSAPLEPLPEPLQALFVRRWFATLGKPEKVEDLIETIRGSDDLAPLVGNAMLLTAICALYDSGGRLPEDGYQLYKSIVGNVLHNRYPGDASERGPVERRLEAIAHGMHTGECAAASRLTFVAEISWVETERLLARFAELTPGHEKDQVEAAVRREDLLNHSGLLVPQPNDRVAFYHLSFQEFLAAQRIARTPDNVAKVFRERGNVPEWRLTLLFLFAAQIANWDAQWGLGLLGRLIKDQDRALVKANPALAWFIAEALDLCLAKKYVVGEELKEDFRRLALDAIDDEVELPARLALGLCLGRLGDRRIFDLRDSRAYVEVPVGTYPYGEHGKTVEIAAPFRLGRYPVTNGQYRAFVDDGGYRDRQWWSEAGWAWQQEKGVTEPELWHDRRWNAPNQPVVGVGFWVAEACCAWAGGRLPREEEWEAAARGPQGFQYPWGNAWEDDICNTLDAGLGVTSPVGLFPRARQAELDIEDLAGNVWEWCGSLYDFSHIRAPNAPRVLRGGSWSVNPSLACSAGRLRSDIYYRSDSIGFRVLCSSHANEH